VISPTSIYIFLKKRSRRGQSTHFTAGESWEKPAAELALPTACDSTYNQDFLMQDTLITTTVLKQQAAALLCEEKKVIYMGTFQAKTVLC